MLAEPTEDNGSRTLGPVKTIALVAHDHMKDMLLSWIEVRCDILRRHTLVGTGTTGAMIEQRTDLSVERLLSGPLGGDQQLGARIAEGRIDIMIFFWDPLRSVPHDPDVKALLRLATVWNIPIACNQASADFLIDSPHLTRAYETRVPDYKTYMQRRTGADT